MKCKANENGWNGIFISEGQVFESKKCPSWATPVKVSKAPKAEEAESEEMIALRAKAKELGYSKHHNAGEVKLKKFIKEAEEAIAAKEDADKKADEADEAEELADKEQADADAANK